MAIRRPTLLLGKQLRVKVGTEADEATRALTSAWVKAWDILSADMEAAVLEVMNLAAKLDRWPATYELNRVDRLYRVMTAAQRTLAELGTRAGVTITDAAGRAIQTTADSEPGLIASQLPAAEQATALKLYASRIKPSALDIIVKRTSEQITAATLPLSGEGVEAMHRELIRGVAVGSNPREAGARMLAGLQDGFNGGLARATNIARTEILDAYRTTSEYAHTANADVLDGWIWLCALSERTCPACLAKNGSVHPLTESGPQDHQSGRCSRMPQVKSWAALGIKAPEPTGTIPDARKWFAEQPVATQRQIMGPGRLDLLNSGAISWDQIPARRENPGWRPSYAPRSLGDLQKVAKRNAAA